MLCNLAPAPRGRIRPELTPQQSLPPAQREGIKNYVVQRVIAMSSAPAADSGTRLVLSKLNQVLIQVVKQEWPTGWPSFIPDVVGSSKTSESLCENNMKILQLLSEEVFDFSSGQMTSTKIAELKESLCNDFSQIFTLCEYILANSQKESLIKTTLETLLRFLNWIPLGFIFEQKLIEQLVFQYLPMPALRNVTLKCAIEIASLDIGTFYNAQFDKLFQLVVTHVRAMMPLATTSFVDSYDDMSEEDQNFVCDFALFVSKFLRLHAPAVEGSCPALVNEALMYCRLRSCLCMAAIDVLTPCFFASCSFPIQGALREFPIPPAILTLSPRAQPHHSTWCKSHTWRTRSCSRSASTTGTTCRGTCTRRRRTRPRPRPRVAR